MISDVIYTYPLCPVPNYRIMFPVKTPAATEAQHSLDPRTKICLMSRFFDLRNTGIGRFLGGNAEWAEETRIRPNLSQRVRNSNAAYFFYTAFQLARKLPKGYDVYHSLTPMEAIHAPKPSSIVTFHDVIPMLHLDKTETHYAQGAGKGLKRFISKNYFRFAAKAAAKCNVIACDSEQTRAELIEYLKVAEEKSGGGAAGHRPWPCARAEERQDIPRRHVELP